MNRKQTITLTLLLLLALAGLTLALGRLLPEGERLEALKVTVLKVGKADAIVVQTGGKTMVIDAGEEDDGEEVTAFLTDQGVSAVDVLIITHFDKDHVGGADTLVERLAVERVLLPDYSGSGAEYLDFLAALEAAGITPERLTEPVRFRLGEAQVLVEPPELSAEARIIDGLDNDFSLITTLTHGENRFLFTGDAEKARLEQWLAGEGEKGCDFLKMPHHGVYNTALEELLEAAAPTYAAICTSDKHPAQTLTLELLKSRGVAALETRNGDITVLSDGRTLEVRQRKT